MAFVTFATDTAPGAADFVVRRWREMSPAERLDLVRGATIAARELERAGLRLREPDLDDSELFARLAVKRLGATLAARVYGGWPDAR